jgi:hypothetical protein
MTTDEWFILRDIIYFAAHVHNPQRPPENAPDHEAVALVRNYCLTRDQSLIDRAARLVAMQKPGIDPAFAEEHYWLVIDKS